MNAGQGGGSSTSGSESRGEKFEENALALIELGKGTQGSKRINTHRQESAPRDLCPRGKEKSAQKVKVYGKEA